MIQDTYFEVGQTVRRLRLQNALTQEELADKAGLSAKTVSRVETGHRTQGSTYRKLAVIFGVPVKELLAPLGDADDAGGLVSEPDDPMRRQK